MGTRGVFFDEVRRLWFGTSGDLLYKIDNVRRGLGLWAVIGEIIGMGLKSDSRRSWKN